MNILLLKVHKCLEKLDSGGRTLRRVFEEKPRAQFCVFKNYMVGLEIWGSFSPLTPKCYDIQLTRTAAYTKLITLRKTLKQIA